jgi:NifU-like protein involved in Fe-S cluster formation
MTWDPYNAEARRLFSAPLHAGDADDGYPMRLVSEASESTEGAGIQLSAGVENDVISELRYRVFGCPHLIAAAEWACENLEGQSTSELGAFDREACMRILDVPVEKTGRILLLEDALAGLGKQLPASN